MIAVRIEPQIEKRLERLAKGTGRTKTYYVREAVLAHLADLEDGEIARKRLRQPGKTHPASTVRAAVAKSKVRLPDFLARLKKISGGRVAPDSKPIFDEMRAERF